MSKPESSETIVTTKTRTPPMKALRVANDVHRALLKVQKQHGLTKLELDAAMQVAMSEIPD